MQKVCDTMVEHKGWTVGHLVAHLNLVESVHNPRVLRYAIKIHVYLNVTADVIS
jgi:hypothetical protein